MIEVTFRPIDAWPPDAGDPYRDYRSNPFRSSWGSTLDLLDRELRALNAHAAVIQLALGEGDIRLDGWPRSSANPEHPGVILAFESRHGPLKYVTAEFHHWQANLRAVALGLEALRKVDRYGITKRGEQYKGWRQLTAGVDEDAGRGHRIIAEHDGDVRAALRATHPDRGGNPEDFRAVMAARSAA